MGCCSSTPRSIDGEHSAAPHEAGFDGARSGAGTASQTALNQQSGSHHNQRNSPTGPRLPRNINEALALSGSSSPADPRSPSTSDPHAVPSNQLRPHVWTGRQRPSRSYQGDVSAHRKIWTRRSLDRERIAFFETRVSNRADIWATLREVVTLVRDGESDSIQEAQAILDAAGIMVPSGDLADGAYDENGNFYPLVEYVVCDPKDIRPEESEGEDDEGDDDEEESEEERRLEKGKSVDRVPAEAITVRARLSNRGGPEADVKVRVGKSESVRVLAKRIKGEAGLSETSRVRIAYLGRVLKENRTLEEQGYETPHMVNALVSENTGAT